MKPSGKNQQLILTTLQPFTDISATPCRSSWQVRHNKEKRVRVAQTTSWRTTGSPSLSSRMPHGSLATSSPKRRAALGMTIRAMADGNSRQSGRFPHLQRRGHHARVPRGLSAPASRSSDQVAHLLAIRRSPPSSLGFCERGAQNRGKERHLVDVRRQPSDELFQAVIQ